MKIIGLAALALLLAVGLYVWKTEFGDGEVFILPDGYTGVVYIFYNQDKGEPVKYEQRKRVYEIPSNGILKTQFSLNTGWHHFGEFYYRQESGNLIRIPFVFQGKDMESKKDIDPNAVHVCCGSSGNAGRGPREPRVVFEHFYVGTDDEIHAASERSEKINPIDLVN